MWCNIDRKCNHIRFCAAGTISTRRIHRKEFLGKELKEMQVRCRLARYWFQSHPNVDCDADANEWRVASIKRVDKHSGQCQLVMHIQNKDYLWWTHLDSVQEVQPLSVDGAATAATDVYYGMNRQ